MRTTRLDKEKLKDIQAHYGSKKQLKNSGMEYLEKESCEAPIKRSLFKYVFSKTIKAAEMRMFGKCIFTRRQGLRPAMGRELGLGAANTPDTP